MNISKVKQIQGGRSGEADHAGSTAAASSVRITPWVIVLAVTMFAAVILGPVLEALIAYAFYRHWGVALAERANVQPGVVAASVPALITAILILRNGHRRRLSRPWSWLRPYILVFF